MAEYYFPGPITNKISDHQDDNDSVIYASTDDGWTHDGASERNGPANNNMSTHYSRSDSPDLIDFSEPTDLTLQTSGATSEERCESRSNLESSQGKQVPDLKAYPQAQKSLNPASRDFTPSRCSAPHRQPSYPSSHSSYVDARQSLDSQDSQIMSLRDHIKNLERDHETLKRENDNLDTVNEKLKHKIGKDVEKIQRLKEQAAVNEDLRIRAERTAVETNEINERLQATLVQLQEDLEERDSHLLEYKKKLAGALNNSRPLENRLQETEVRLLNTVERIKMIEAFARNHLATHPESKEPFASVGLFPHGAPQQRHAFDQIEAEPVALISFDEPDHCPTVSSRSLVDDLHRDYKVNANAEFQTENKTAVPTHSQFYDNQILPQGFERQSIESQTKLDNPEGCPSNTTGLNWKCGSHDIWDSELEKVRAIRNHQGALPTMPTPGMLIHGIRFVRHHIGQKLIADDDIQDLECRRVVISGLPDNVHIQRVLEHVRGGQVLKAHTATLGNGDDRVNMAYIEFVSAKDAIAFYRFTRCREFGFVANGHCVRVRTTLPASDSFPLGEVVQAQLRQGCTRCLIITDFPVIHLKQVLESAGISHTFADIVTHFNCFADGTFEVSFSDIQHAVAVRNRILKSDFYTGTPDGSGVAFTRDPCDAPLEGLQKPFLTIESTSDLGFLNQPAVSNEGEPRPNGEKLLEEAVTAADPDDPESPQEHHLQGNLVWEKRANWDDIPIYMAYDPDQRRQVPHQRDPASGAVRHQYHGSWVISPAEARKEWLYYNHESPHPWTQKTADLIYASTGQIDLRKVVVDDGGVYGEARQTMIQSSTKTSKHNLVGGYDNITGSNTPLASPSPSVASEDIGVGLHGISKASFNKLIAVRDANRRKLTTSRKHLDTQGPFW